MGYASVALDQAIEQSNVIVMDVQNVKREEKNTIQDCVQKICLTKSKIVQDSIINSKLAKQKNSKPVSYSNQRPIKGNNTCKKAFTS